MKSTFIFFGLIVVLLHLTCISSIAGEEAAGAGIKSIPSMTKMVGNFSKSTGLLNFIFPSNNKWTDGIGRLIMIGIGILLLYLAV
ncbi:MAG: hypothetical protein EHM30_09940, partial [Desulfobacteraceae bacterium]